MTITELRGILSAEKPFTDGETALLLTAMEEDCIGRMELGEVL